jgi:hypothetical protein
MTTFSRVTLPTVLTALNALLLVENDYITGPGPSPLS